MVDNLSQEQRSLNMASIRSKDTEPEQIVRSFLHKRGFRFKLYNDTLPGKPDITLAKFDTVVFVNGCFWHCHSGCKRATIPKSNRRYWKSKLENNVKQLDNNKRRLRRLGWKVIEIWECEIKDQKKIEKRFVKLLNQKRKL